jgi:hypothetical protein
MPWTMRPQPITPRSLFRGLVDLPWDAPLFGPVRLKRPVD